MQCPGQDSRYWDGEAIFEAKCSKCGTTVEFFKDDNNRKCAQCGHRVLNPRIDFGCAAYCPHAEQCLGSLPPELLNQKQHLLVDRVAIEMKRYFGTDFKRIGHAGKVARYAEKIGKQEEGNPAVIQIAAYLHDLGRKESAGQEQNSGAPRDQEGPPLAAEILRKLGANPGLIEEVCEIIGRQHAPRPEETSNFKALYDAVLLVKLEDQEKEKPSPPEQRRGMIAASFLTASGRDLATTILLPPPPPAAD